MNPTMDIIYQLAQPQHPGYSVICNEDGRTVHLT